MNCPLFLEKKNINKFVSIRILIGCFFIFSGFEKLVRPYENFLYIIEGYQILIKPLAEIVAIILPWFEFILGIFLILGLWSRVALRALLILTTAFLLTVSQALLRNLPIKDCGCFGELFSIPLPTILIFDGCLLILIAVLIAFREEASHLSLDRYFLKKQ